MENKIKLCKNCRFYKSTFIFAEKDCTHPNNTVTDLVVGGQRFQWSPQALRSVIADCGPLGAWFEEKNKNGKRLTKNEKGS
jgi:hypothetical protein